MEIGSGFVRDQNTAEFYVLRTFYIEAANII